MKLIIDIDENLYKVVQNEVKGKVNVSNVWTAIANGIPYEERPKGEWLSLSDVSPSGFGTWVCSQCGQGFRGIKSKMPYCTCGADMRGEE